MGKLRVLSGAEVCEILTAHGFSPVRQRGSHVVMQRREGNSTITVVVPNHRELKTGTLGSIIRTKPNPAERLRNTAKLNIRRSHVAEHVG